MKTYEVTMRVMIRPTWVITAWGEAEAERHMRRGLSMTLATPPLNLTPQEEHFQLVSVDEKEGGYRSPSGRDPKTGELLSEV